MADLDSDVDVRGQWMRAIRPAELTIVLGCPRRNYVQFIYDVVGRNVTTLQRVGKLGNMLYIICVTYRSVQIYQKCKSRSM